MVNERFVTVGSIPRSRICGCISEPRGKFRVTGRWQYITVVAPTVAAVCLILLCLFHRIWLVICREFGTMSGSLLRLQVWSTEYNNDTYEFFEEFYGYPSTVYHC